jgi:hypothetical protein
MPMSSYLVLCYNPECGKPAQYKIAARWSDGVTEELKTYSLCCDSCLPELFRQGRTKQAACRLAAGEKSDPPGIYSLERGRRDAQIHRLLDVEERMLRAE